MHSEHLVDAATRHQVYLERYKASLLAGAGALFLSLEREIRAALLDLDTSQLGDLTAAQAARLIETIRARTFQAYDAQLSGFALALHDFASFEREFELSTLNEATKDEVTPDDGNFAAILWAYILERPMSTTGALLSAFLAAWMQHEVTRSVDLVRLAVSQNWTTTRLLTGFRGTKANRNTDGLLGSAKRNTRTTINTAVQHVSSTARHGVMENVVFTPAKPKPKASPVKLLGYLWVSILDSVTSQTCRSLDGRVFPFGEGPLPPIHPNCRSTIVAWLPRALHRLEADTRPAKGAAGAETVSANQTYYEWLKRQPAEFQNDALGVTRAALFRKGGLSAAQFAKLNLGRNFEPLTLDEMRRLAPRAFKRAGV